MINLKELIFIKRGFLSQKECSEIISEYENNPSESTYECCPHAFTGENIWSPNKVKRPNIQSNAFNIIHESIQTMVNEYHDYMDSYEAFHVDRRFTLLHPHLYRLMKYEKGTWIHPHTDHDAGVYGSCTINLNDDYEGGMFAFWGGKHKVKLEKGDAMIWPADHLWVHQVEEITKGVRYSVNCFLRDSPLHLPKSVTYDIKMPNKLMEERLSYFRQHKNEIMDTKNGKNV